MPAASYSIPELTTLNTGESTTGWAEPGTWIAGGLPVAETDYFIQGTGCIDKTFNATGLGGLMYDSGADQALTASEVFLAWLYFEAPNALESYANGGARLMVGSANTAFKAWAVFGANTYAYGGWRCIPVDPAIAAEYTVGVPTAGNHRFFGVAYNLVNAVSKGNPAAIDCIRYGRGTLQVIDGQAGAFGTFDGAATQDQNVSNRWGLCQLIDGTFVMQGHFLMGIAATAVDFRDSSRNLVIANTLKVQSTFNLFEIRNASSRVDWTNVSITALGTVSRGDLLATDNATINLVSCIFTDMGTFGFLGLSTITSTVFRRCNLVTQSSSTITGCTFDSTNDATRALLCNDPTKVSGCTFLSSGTKHGMELSATGTYNFVNNVFTGYASVDGSTGNESVYNNSGGLVTLNITGATPTIRNGAGASTVIVAGTVTTEITVKDINTGAAIASARVLVTASDNTGPMPFDETVTITRSGATATVSHTAHGLVDGKKVLIKGAGEQEYNGVFVLTFINANSYSYTVSGSPATPATGTIKSTGVVIDGLTNASGVISDTRSHAGNQPITGRARKATGGTLYKTGPVSGIVNSTTGFSTTVQLIPDA